MVAELGGQRLVRGVIRILAIRDELPRHLPDRVMASQEHDAALLQRRDSAAANSVWILASRKRGGLGYDQRVSLKKRVGNRSEFVLVPHRLVEQCEVSRAVRGGDGKKILVSEGEDLPIDRVAHQIEPRTREYGVVPYLLASAAIGDDLGERFVIPEIRMLENHRDGLEVASARRATQPIHQLRELPGIGWDDPLGHGGARGTSGNRSGADRQRSKTDKSGAPRAIDRHSCLLSERPCGS